MYSRHTVILYCFIVFELLIFIVILHVNFSPYQCLKHTLICVSLPLQQRFFFCLVCASIFLFFCLFGIYVIWWPASSLLFFWTTFIPSLSAYMYNVYPCILFYYSVNRIALILLCKGKLSYPPPPLQDNFRFRRGGKSGRTAKFFTQES